MPWKEVTDPATKKVYYFNSETKATSWKRPADFAPNEPSALGSAAGADPTSSVADWVAKEDPTTKKTYYYNKKTKATSWKKPDGFVEEEKTAPKDATPPPQASTLAASATPPPPQAHQAAQPSGDWVAKEDPTTKKTYYYNKKTKATSWKRPPEMNAAIAEEAAPTAPSTAPPAAVAVAAPAPPAVEVSDWVAKEDPTTKKTYYYNKKTKATSWKKPDGFVENPSVVASSTTPPSQQQQQAQQQQQPGASPRPAAAAAVSDPASDWAEVTDPKTGKTYFFNKVTKETSWKRPEALAAPAPVAPAVATTATSVAKAATAPAASNSGPDAAIDAIVASLGPDWVKRYEHRTSTVYALNTRTLERKWLDSVTNEFTSMLQMHHVPHDTVFVIGGQASGKERQSVFVYLGTRWAVLDYQAHGIPYDFHSVHAVRTGPGGCVLVGMRRDPGALMAAMSWNALERTCVQQPHLLSSYSPGAAYCAVPKGMLATGGATDSTLTSPRGTATLHDFLSGAAHELPPMRVARSGHTVSVVDSSNEIRMLWFAYCIGGFDGKRKTASVERYVLGASQWDLLSPLGTPRSGHCAFVVDKTIHVVGGRSGYGVTNTMEAMHIQTDAWSPMAPMRVPRCSFGVAQVGTYILAVGGFNGAEWLSSVECYDPRIDFWRDVVALPTPCCSMAVCTLRRSKDPLAPLDEAERR